jgi:hypothetical protein
LEIWAPLTSIGHYNLPNTSDGCRYALTPFTFFGCLPCGDYLPLSSANKFEAGSANGIAAQKPRHEQKENATNSNPDNSAPDAQMLLQSREIKHDVYQSSQTNCVGVNTSNLPEIRLHRLRDAVTMPLVKRPYDVLSSVADRTVTAQRKDWKVENDKPFGRYEGTVSMKVPLAVVCPSNSLR